MSSIKYKYTPIPNLSDDNGKFIRRPILKIYFAGTQLSAYGLIDSGADNSMMNIGYAKLLGINLDENNRKRFRGIMGESVDCYMTKVTIIAEYFEKYPLTIPVAFIDSQNVDVLIGQDGFFDKFKIKFEKDHETFELSRSVK